MNGREEIHSWTTVEEGMLASNSDSNSNNHNTIDGADSVQGSSTPVRAGKEGDEATRFVFNVVDAAVTHPNDAVVGENVDEKVAVQKVALPAEATDDGEQGTWGVGLFVILCCVGICTLVRSAHPPITLAYTLSLHSIVLVNTHSLSYSLVRSVFAVGNGSFPKQRQTRNLGARPKRFGAFSKGWSDANSNAPNWSSDQKKFASNQTRFGLSDSRRRKVFGSFGKTLIRSNQKRLHRTKPFLVAHKKSRKIPYWKRSNDKQREAVFEREALSFIRDTIADQNLDRYLPHLDAKKNRLRNGDSIAGSTTDL